MKSDLFVIGASGFIGSAVCSELAGKGVSVSAVSRTRRPEIQGLHWIHVENYLELVLPPGGICIHLGGRSQFQSTDDLELEQDQALALTERVARHDFSQVIFASTALVYGDHLDSLRRETEPVFPESAYARMKWEAEKITLESGRIIARIANVYGVGMAESNVFSRILRELDEPGGITVRDLNAVRDFIDVRDVARGLAALALGERPGIFNIGSGRGTSIRHLVASIGEEAGASTSQMVAEVEDSPESTLVVDPGKMKETFGWRAEIDLRKGIRHLLANRSLDRTSLETRAGT